MPSVRSPILVLSLGLVSLSLLQCTGGGAEPVVPGPPAPPPPLPCVPAPAPESTAHPAAPDVAAVHGGHEGAHGGAEASHGALPHWSYAGEQGPLSWGDLSPEFAPCKTGTRQSPIDIPAREVDVDRSGHALEFSYRSPLPLQIFNNGHTVQVQNGGRLAIRVGEEEWKLVQLHFHSPSEHAIDGKLYDMEMHLVHANEHGELSVVGLLFKRGKENKALAEVFEHMPAEVTKEAEPVAGASVDLAKVLPPKPAYYAYSGSLTTPKCTEGVHWYVLKPIAEISDVQLQKFRMATHGDTNRPVQPLGARKVTRSN